MGEHLGSNPTLYVDAGNGWQPMGKIEETPEFIADGDVPHDMVEQRKDTVGSSKVQDKAADTENIEQERN